MINIAIYASGSGTNAENLITYFKSSKKANVKIILCNNANAGVIERAARLKVPCEIFSKENLKGTKDILDREGIDFIILAGFLLKVPDEIIEAYPRKTVNIHPALIPNYCGKGMYGHHVHEAVIAAHEKESGITIHLVDNHYDHGQILFQAKCSIDSTDTPDDLAAKIHILEQTYFPKVVDEYLTTQASIDRICSDLFAESDINLMRFALNDTYSQEELDDLLKVWDLEVAGAQKALLLSYVMKAHPDLKFPDYFGPRLSGLINYYRFHNVKLMSNFKKICSEISNEGIEIVPIKGGAMKALRPDYAREMGDIDILVPETDYSRAINIAKRLGYKLFKDIHSTDIHENETNDSVMDIHKWILITSGKGRKITPQIFERASKHNVFGVDVLLPCNEDILFISMINFSRNIMDRTSQKGAPFTLFDIKYLIQSKDTFDWNIIKENAVKTSSEAEISLLSRFINHIIPHLIPSEMETLSEEKEIRAFGSLWLFRRFYLSPLQERSHQLGVSEVMRHPSNLPAFICVRPKYTFMKLFKYSPRAAGVIIKAKCFSSN